MITGPGAKLVPQAPSGLHGAPRAAGVPARETAPGAVRAWRLYGRPVHWPLRVAGGALRARLPCCATRRVHRHRPESVCSGQRDLQRPQPGRSSGRPGSTRRQWRSGIAAACTPEGRGERGRTWQETQACEAGASDGQRPHELRPSSRTRWWR